MFRAGLLKAVYAGSVVFFLWLLSGFYLPGKGFSALLLLGDKMAEHALPEFVAIGPYTEANSYGYDGQFYVQMAVNPDLRNPDLAVAIDSLPYRARRILLSWTAWAIGGGDAVRAVQVFSVQNVVCWIALAALLLWWFPPTNWENYFRWAGVLFCYGLCFSVRASLLDGPSLLFITVGVMLFEQGWPWWSTAVLAISGLVRETNVMTASLLMTPGKKKWGEWAGMLVRGAVVVLPCALWVLYLNYIFGPHEVGGSGNFSLPFEAYGRKIAVTLTEIREVGWTEANFSNVTMLVALSVQAAFLMLRPRWSQSWWRIGAPYVVLMIALGDAMWEGYPGAAARALLPMTLAFNVLLPRGRHWWVLLLLGNATVFSAFGMFRVPAGQSYRLTSVPALAVAAKDHQPWQVAFDGNWYGPERSRGEYWAWSRGSASVTIHNPHAFAVLADITGLLKSVDSRLVTIRANGRALWSDSVGPGRVDFTLNRVSLDPGVTTFAFETDREARPPGEGEKRQLAFSLRNLTFRIVAPLTADTTADGEK